MILRPRQKEFVDRSVSALSSGTNTLGVAPTGAGKTVMLSAVVGRLLDGGAERAIILQHRDELTAQNRETFHRLNGWGRQSGVIDARLKDTMKPITFAMVQTLARGDTLNRLPAQDILVIDEAHHVAAASYRKIIDALAEANPALKLFGVTATPNRGDKKPLVGIFDNCADQITLSELISVGALVRPRTFVVDLGVRDDLARVKRSVSDFDMSEVAKILDRQVLNEQVVSKWKEQAGERATVVFCSTVEHAQHVTAAFQAAGVSAACVEGSMGYRDRINTLKEFEAGRIQVIVNVAVLTEGWDCQTVSCIVLLRPSSYKSTMIQMIGRGLRRQDPERYPGWPAKNDCIVIDFGTSVLMHGSLEQDVDLAPIKGEAPTKECPGCNSRIPATAQECPICGEEMPREDTSASGVEDVEKKAIESFILTEIDLFKQSPFRWEELWEGLVMVATAFDAWTMVVAYQGQWHAMGGIDGKPMRHLQVGEKLMCLATADDFLRENGDAAAAAKSQLWLTMPATDKQMKFLPGFGKMTRYQAACHLTWKFNQKGVQMRLTEVAGRAAA